MIQVLDHTNLAPKANSARNSTPKRTSPRIDPQSIAFAFDQRAILTLPNTISSRAAYIHGNFWGDGDSDSNSKPGRRTRPSFTPSLAWHALLPLASRLPLPPPLPRTRPRIRRIK
ncbi:hypothetical protein CVT25_007645 [Psilocybe cyanescens]|uniref:Uncharacterized protein n=1 Tax=Psilocybe cyanescens TaxID=93625 RepID=A0A409X1E9_PSICY|nr:hypothetical protein CVT25_007645 [Psilocybe cyanescens]